MLGANAMIDAVKLRLKAKLSRIPIRFSYILAISIGISAVFGTQLATRRVESRTSVTVHAAGRGKPYLHFQDGQRMSVDYRGDENATQSLRSGQAQPRAMASADLDGNATPDLVVGYSYNGAGIVTVQRGNPDAFAPQDDLVFARLQQGYNPDSLLPNAETYQVPEPADFVQVGDFNNDNRQDVLVGTRGGDLFLLPGDGQGGMGAAEQITLSGTVSTLAAGEFRAADGKVDAAVGINGPNGAELLVYDGASGGLTGTPMELRLPAEATAVRFGGLDSDPFMDLAVATGSQIEIVHGWGRKQNLSLQSRVENVDAGASVRGLDTGFFVWNRESRTQLAILSDDGSVRILQRGEQNEQAYSEVELTARSKARGNQKRDPAGFDIEQVSGWQPGAAETWRTSREIAGNAIVTDISSQNLLSSASISSRGTENLIVLGGNASSLEVVRQTDPSTTAKNDLFVEAPQSVGTTGDLLSVNLDTTNTPVAALELPAKINGNRDLLVLQQGQSAPDIIPEVATAITVDTTTDNAALSACTGAAGDCSLRGAVAFSSIAANQPTTINIPAGTYVLSIDGTAENGLCGNNSIGDLDIAGNGTSLVGAGAATTIIQQSTANDRVICLDPTVAGGLSYSISGVTIAGGREFDNQSVGGGGLTGGAQNDNLTLTNVVLANNQTRTTSGPGGGGFAITGGGVTMTGCTVGGANAPGVSQADVTLGNSTLVSGGGISFSPGDPLNRQPSAGNLTVTGTTFSHNTAASIAAGGGGADLYTHNLGTGTVSISTSTFSNNQATGGNGGGIVIESIGTTVATTSFTSNTATNKGGGIFVGGGTLTLNGTSPSITFTSNTATNGGGSVSANAPTDVSGTNTTIGGDAEVLTNGTWTNNTGSTLSPTNFSILGGVFTANNSTMNVSGNLVINHEATKGGIFNGNSGTVNIQGNLNVDLNNGGSGALGQFNAGTGTFNFNGTNAQSITNVSAITFNNLTDSNITQPLTANNSFAVGGTLNINGTNAIFDPVAAAIISGAGTLTGTGTARVRRTAATPDFLSQYTITNKTLTNLTVEYIGAAAQVVSALSYGGLKINNASGVSLASTTTVTGLLTLTNGIVTTGANTLSVGLAGTLTRTNGYINGNLNKTFGGAGSFTYALGTLNGYSPVDVNVTAGAGDFTIKATQGPQPNVNPSTSLQRYWTLTATGFTADLVFHYLDGDVAGDESSYRIIRISGGTPVSFPNNCPSSPCVDPANNTGTINGVSSFSDWTLGQQIAPTATNGTVSGRILDEQGNPVSGAAIHLNGTQDRLTITDAQGNYYFDNVEITGFYTVTPSRANYTFSPSQRSFSQLGQHTDAAFTASANSGSIVNPLDTTEYFVRQQYLDFLNREPEEGGFTSWVNEINNCAVGDTSCDRVHVSEMFFRSAEFQQRGYFVYRFYSASFGRKPDYAEFTPDMARVSGFLSNDQLEAAKTQYVNDFMARPAFASQYNSLSNAAYVDALTNAAGISLANRQTLIDALNAGTQTRAQVLRQIAESGEVYQKYYNQAFVVMEYFGYLRREPDALYLDWINTLNQTGDSRHMVNGFVNSTEYRNRFMQ